MYEDPPFSDDERQIQDKLIAKGKYEFYEEYWDEVSGSAQKLIKSLLVIDPKKRLSATDGKLLTYNEPHFC